MDILEQMNRTQGKIKIQIETFLTAMKLTAQDNTYDQRCAAKFEERFKNLQYSYGWLLSFENYVHGCSRYFECENCKKIAKEICKIIKIFISNYEMLL